MKKRVLSLFLVLVMLFTMCPVTVSAENNVNLSATCTNYSISFAVTGAEVATATATPSGDNGTLELALSGATDTVTITPSLSPAGAQAKYYKNFFATPTTVTFEPAEGSTNKTFAAWGTVTNGYQFEAGKWTIKVSMPEGEAFTVTPPTGEGFTFTGKETAYKDGAYSFKIITNEGYDGTNMVVKVNGSEIEGEDGAYTVESVSEDLVITVEGVVAKQIYNVILTEGEGYTISSSDTPYAGEDYTFTVKVDSAYKAGTDGMQVKLDDGTVLNGENGTYTIPALSKDCTVTVEGLVRKAVYSVTKSAAEGSAIAGADAVTEGETYSFTVTIGSGYKTGDDFAIKVNGETKGNAPGSYTVENVSGDLAIAVEGVEPKNVYNVTLTSGEGYTVSGAATVYEGDKYTFTVTIDKSYKTDDTFAVMANGETVNGTNGSYTVENVSADLTITVTGVVKKSPAEMVEPTVVYQNGRDGSNWPYKSGYLNTVTIDGANVKKFTWDGDTCDVQFVTGTSKSAVITFKIAGSGTFFGTRGIKLNGASISSSGTVTLSEGTATAALYVDSAFAKGTKTFNLSIAETNELPRLTDPDNTGDAKEMPAGEGYTLNLASLFTDPDSEAPLTYNLSVNGADAEAITVDEDGKYTYNNNIAGIYTLVFTATDSKGDTSTDTYTVTLTIINAATTYAAQVVVPDGIEASFYAFGGYDANGTDICGDALAVEKNGNTYTVQVPANLDIICFRTSGGSGQAIAVSEDAPASLRKVMVSGADKFDNAVNAAVTVKDADGHAVTAGTDGFILSVGETYTLTTTPSNTTAYKTASNEQTIAADTDAIEALVEFNNLKKITTPTGAKAELFLIENYYSYPEVAHAGTVDNGNGTSTHYFPGATMGSGPAAGATIYRVTYDDHIVKAGWKSGDVTVTFSESDPEKDTRITKVSGAASGAGDDSVLLNVNAQNHLNLSVGSSKTLKAYRVWEIIPVSYNNWIIEPDFHFDVVWESEEGVVSLADKDNPMTGGESWQTLTANKAGTAIIEVSYDAIHTSDGSTWNGTYAASDPTRTGLMVVTVGGADSSVKFGIDGFSSIGTKGPSNTTYNPSAKRDWDAEFDTLYFTEDSGALKFSPTADSAISEVAVSHDKGESWQTLTATDGIYTAEIVPGNNILRVTTASGVAYQVVRGDKVTVTVQEQNDADDNEFIEPGETVRITLDGLHTPIPKMAGNYNPGFGGNDDGYSSVHVNYKLGDQTVYGPGVQYNFHAAANYIDVTIPEDASGEIALTDGYIGVGILGLTEFTTGGDSHRNIPDGGCITRDSKSTWHTRSILPEITIELGAAGSANRAPAAKEDAPTTGEILVGKNYAVNPESLFIDPDSDDLTYTVSVNGGAAETVTAGYKYMPASAGTYTLKFTATDPDGETAEHTITLTAISPDGADDELKFDITGEQIAGYVTVSVEDFGVRRADEKGLKFPVALGEIVAPTQVPYAEGDTVAKVTLRLLDALKIGYSYTGSVTSGFYLGALKNFEVDDTPYDSMAEKDAGEGSGWMITLNNWFIDKGASDFTVKNGDVVEWKYSCQTGRDIGDDASNPSAEITGLNFKEDYGTLAPAFANDVTAYNYYLKNADTATIAFETVMANYKAKVTLNGTTDMLQPMQNIAVANGTKITVISTYDLGENDLTDTLSILICAGDYDADRAAAQAAVDAIAQIPAEITLDSAAAITAADTAYTTLTEAQKNLVGAANVSKLDGAKTALKALQDQQTADQNAAKAWDDSVSAIIAEITLSDAEAITAALASYNELTDVQKALTTKLDALNAAKADVEAMQAAVDNVEALIAAIGTPVTLDSKAKIEAADNAYEALASAELKDAVGNYYVLQNAKAVLSALEAQDNADKAMAAAMDSQIEAIGTVTLAKEAQIHAARTAYTNLSDAAKGYVTKLNVLEAAESVLAELKAAVENVVTLIDAIGTVALESKDAIDAARAAYDALATEELKNAVANYSDLTAAEAAYNALSANAEAAAAVVNAIGAIGDVTLSDAEAIATARTAYDALTAEQKALVSNLAVLEAAEAALKQLMLAEIYEKTAETLVNTEVTTGTVAGEWLMFGLARALDKQPTAAQNAAYLVAVKSYIAENIDSNGRLDEDKATENQRIALALTALGCNAASFEGYDLVRALTDTDWVTAQGNNSTAFALLTLDATGYAAANKQALLNSLLENQLASGAWSIDSEEADSDTTAMIIQALAPYYATDADVKDAVDKALTYLASLMNTRGHISPAGFAPTAENTAQVVVALSALGLDAADNTQFTKNGKTLLDGLMSFYLEEEAGFAHSFGDTAANQMATEQAFYALVAYDRMKKGENSLYDMSDVVGTYGIAVQEAENGTVTVDKQRAAAGETITVTLAPATGYEVDSVSVGTTQLTVTNNKATFTMPAADVTICASFKLSENAADELASAMAAITKNDVKNADEDAYELLLEIEKAFEALTEAQQEALLQTDAYKNYEEQLERFEDKLDNLKADGEDELEDLLAEYDERDYTEKNWKKIKSIYKEALLAIDDAAYAEEIEAILKDAKKELKKVPVGGEIKVTFRLIGDFKHDNGVSDHDEYVTWIETTEYTLEAGATMYDLFMMAIDDFDLNQKGAKNNYVESIQAPDVLGGYWIGEFDNGRNSGWMYTVNGKHPGTGLVYQALEDGDEVIWHYVDDYTKEERNSKSEYYERWLEAKDISPEKYVERILDEIVTVGKHGTVKPTLDIDDIGEDITFRFIPDEGYVVENVIVDGKSKGAIETYTYKDLSIDSRIKVTFALAGAEEVIVPQQTFTDVAPGAWYADAVAYVSANGLFSGTGNGNFSPNTTMSRAMMVTVLHNMAQNPTAYNANRFGDVTSGAWYDEAVRWATANGITAGYTNGKFGTNDDVTREQIAVFLYNYAKAMGYDVSARASLAYFADDESVSTYAKTAMQWAVAEGILSGRTGNKLAAKSNASRAEVATMICNFAQNIAK